MEEICFTDLERACGEIWERLKLGEEEFETAAVITMTQEEARRAAAYFSKRLRQEERFFCTYVDKESTNFHKGLTVTTFYLLKGLEFDQVFAICGEWQSHPRIVRRSISWRLERFMSSMSMRLCRADKEGVTKAVEDFCDALALFTPASIQWLFLSLIVICKKN